MKKETLYFFILIVTAFVFAVITFFTPLIHDDFAFLFKYGPKADVRPTASRVENVADVFESQYYFYQTVNGRFTTHFLLQLVLMLGKYIFNLLNVLVFTGLVLLVSNYHRNSVSQSTDICILLFVIFSIWFFLPFFGQTMLWGAGALNYLWASTFVVLFLYYFQRSAQTNYPSSGFKLFLLFLISFFIGNTNESITFGVGTALLLFMVFNFRKQTPGSFAMVLGFGLGLLAIVFSPGTVSRAHNEVEMYFSLPEIINQKAIEIVGIFYLLKLPLATSLVLLTCLKVKKVPVLKILIQEKVIILSVIFNCLLLLAIGRLEVRMLFGVTMLITMLNVVLLTEFLWFVPRKKSFILSIFFCCFLVVGFYTALIKVNDYRKKNIIFTTQLKDKNKKVFYFPYFEESRFVYHTLGGVSDSKNYHNRVKSFYYGLSEINILPEKLRNHIYNSLEHTNKKQWSEEWGNNVMLLDKDHYGVIKLPPKFHYNELLEAKLVFSNGKEKSIPVAVIPGMEGYYAFLKTEIQNFDYAVSITIVNNSGVTIQKIEKSLK